MGLWELDSSNENVMNNKFKILMKISLFDLDESRISWQHSGSIPFTRVLRECVMFLQGITNKA
jgi:hypothetical protein